MATGLLDYLEAIGETGATLGSGAAATLAGIPYGILQNIRSGKYGTKEGVKLADKATQDFIKQYTYAPRGQMAQNALQSVAGLLESTKLPPVLPEAGLLAAIPKATYASQFERAGMAAERAMEPVAANVMARGGLPAQLLQDLTQGTVRNVVPPDVARKFNMPVNLPQSKEFLKAVENEPSAQITNEGLLMNLVRKQSPEQAMAESVRTGVFYLPEGQASNLKHYKGKSGYGGSEMIEGQTLYKNPIFVKGATGGKAPASAYDQVVGKGAYEEMRNDVLKSYGYNANQSQKIDAVQGLLQKYNGLDSDDAYNMAYNIVSNSKTGNTLPYAVQENIVGNAVRNAGHDAVIGYGKGRGDKGEFFSEVFDVREQAYPNTQGGYELMPQFEGLLGPITPQPMYVVPPGKGVKPINLSKGIYKPDLTMEEMLKVKDIPTVDRVKQSIDLVGEKEFEKMVNAQYKKYKPSDPDQEAMLVESVTLQILGKAQRNVGKKGLPSSQSLTMPSIPTVEQMPQSKSLLDMNRTPSEAEIKKAPREDLINWLQNNDPNGTYLDPTPDPAINMYRTAKGYAIEDANTGSVSEFGDYNKAKQEFDALRFSNSEFQPMTLKEAQDSAINYLRESAQPAGGGKLLQFGSKPSGLLD